MLTTNTPVRGRVHFVKAADGEYAVEVRRGATRASVGRVTGARTGWTALGIGMPAWTAWKPTRVEAVDAMLARRTFTDEAATR